MSLLPPSLCLLPPLSLSLSLSLYFSPSLTLSCLPHLFMTDETRFYGCGCHPPLSSPLLLGLPWIVYCLRVSILLPFILLAPVPIYSLCLSAPHSLMICWLYCWRMQTPAVPLWLCLNTFPLTVLSVYAL